jgi:hypothetical protein
VSAEDEGIGAEETRGRARESALVESCCHLRELRPLAPRLGRNP